MRTSSSRARARSISYLFRRRRRRQGTSASSPALNLNCKCVFKPPLSSLYRAMLRLFRRILSRVCTPLLFCFTRGNCVSLSLSYFSSLAFSLYMPFSENFNLNCCLVIPRLFSSCEKLLVTNEALNWINVTKPFHSISRSRRF